MKYVVIRDTREQKNKGWVWDKSDSCDGTIDRTLKTADYTLLGFEDIFVIERKGSVSEWAGNLTKSVKRFKKELVRLQQFKYPFIFLEFTPNDLMGFPYTSNIPKQKLKYMKINGHILLKIMWELTLEYEIPIWFVGQKGKEFASSLFKRIVEKNG